MNRVKTEKRSFKDRFLNYLIENVDVIASGIFILSGNVYYPKNGRKSL